MDGRVIVQNVNTGNNLGFSGRLVKLDQFAVNSAL